MKIIWATKIFNEKYRFLKIKIIEKIKNKNFYLKNEMLKIKSYKILYNYIRYFIII